MHHLTPPKTEALLLFLIFRGAEIRESQGLCQNFNPRKWSGRCLRGIPPATSSRRHMIPLLLGSRFLSQLAKVYTAVSTSYYTG